MYVISINCVYCTLLKTESTVYLTGYSSLQVLYTFPTAIFKISTCMYVLYFTLKFNHQNEYLLSMLL